MSNKTIIEVTLTRQKPLVKGYRCPFGHKVGDKIVFDGRSIKGDICYSTLLVLLPKIHAMCYGAEWPFGDPDVVINDCPDPGIQNLWEVRRVRSPQYPEDAKPEIIAPHNPVSVFLPGDRTKKM